MRIKQGIIALAIAAATLVAVPVVRTADAKSGNLLIASQRPNQPNMQRPRIDVVFALDTTGSMSSLIKGAKAKIWSIINVLAGGQPTPIIRVGLIGYRDKGDAYVTKRYPLSNDLDNVYGNLVGFQAAGGGDTPEHVNQALYEAVHSMNWSQANRVLKVVFLVGDAPPKMYYQDDVKYHVIARTARQKGIVINTIRCGMSTQTEMVWKQIAHLAGGKFLTIHQSGGMHAIATPYDGKLSKLGRDLDKTIVFHGSTHVRRRAIGGLLKGDSLTRGISGEAAAGRASFRAKMVGAGIGIAKRDLVRLYRKNPKAIAAIKTKDLPPALAKMNLAQRKRYLAAQWQKRRRIQKTLLKLAHKREKYLKTYRAQLARKAAAAAKRYAAAARRHYKRTGRRDYAATAPPPRARPSFSAGVRRMLKRQAKEKAAVDFAD